MALVFQPLKVSDSLTSAAWKILDTHIGSSQPIFAN